MPNDKDKLIVTINILNTFFILLYCYIIIYHIYIMQKYLISLCDTNKCDVIIVTSKSTIIFDVTQKIINKNISTNIVTFVSKLEQKLKFSFHG